MQRTTMQTSAPISEAEYLAGEALSPVKHAYLDGELPARPLALAAVHVGMAFPPGEAPESA